ncbi:hypothetical protein B0F90DRAFT_1809754 [Multifurca ochricompacta]|uniref:VWFA domain-containing protein n=1 Tax=Multifurca ochricompacta TaxID=376703 RepID=A0AAD4M6X7_9AGAM|nr:hypothetical protein B0F90DRAFT_1809754 [Multifurca ochricompacta]
MSQQDVHFHRPPLASSTDLAERVKGMYRLLDLIGESGSNGFVDKVIIAQGALQHFINELSPGAYASISRVDFKALDRFMIKPLGVYGSKDEIVRLLRSIGAVDENTARLLLAPAGTGSSRLTLSSGLYVVRANATDLTDERHYVIYWPEDSTWSDSAASPVRRNRVTFMRYLTKICDQVIGLLSPEHSASIVWNNEEDDAESPDIDPGESDRLFTFEVSETNEQEEGAAAYPGFQTVPDCPVDPAVFVPRLLPGETTQGFLTASYVPYQTQSEAFDQHTFSQVSLKQLLMNNALVLSENLDERAMQTLADIALVDIFPEQYEKWRAVAHNTRNMFMRESTERRDTIHREVARGEDALRRVLREAVVDEVLKLFPSLERDRLSSRERTGNNSNASQGAERSMRLFDLESLYPDFRGIYLRHLQSARFDNVLRRVSNFESRKLRLIAVHHLLEKNQTLQPEMRAELIQTLLFEGDFHRAYHMLPTSNVKKRSTMGTWAVGSLFSGSSDSEDSFNKDMRIFAANVPDSQFLLEMKGAENEEMRPVILEVEALAHAQLASSIDATVKSMTRAVLVMQQDYCRKSIQHEMESEERKLLSQALVEFIRDINAQSLEFWTHPIDLTSDDKHSMQLDPQYIPNPTVNDRLSSMFHVPVGTDIAFHQLLENEKLLLVLVDQDKLAIYLERLPAMDMAIQQNRPLKCLNRERLGQDALFAFDETTRALAVCAPTKLQLHMFVFDETFKALRGQGSTVNLTPWYGQPGVSILQAAFVCGTEEIVLVDSSAQARIFSFVTLQFRPASLQLPSIPRSIFSSPDGSCLLILHTQDTRLSLTAYHWETFGSNDGIDLDVPAFPIEGATLTSMVSRGRIFLLGLDIEAGFVKSIAINITKKLTEFMFKENSGKNASDNGARLTLHNSLLDCHAEVWSRFPVLAAVKRRTVTSSSERKPKSLTFIANNHSQPFESYFSDLIQTFERTTRKPTGDELRRIKVSAIRFESFRDKVLLESEWDASRYRVGEWLVDVLCLIPIHIAVCRENRFVPLADGVLSADLERSLLGAEVSKIVDKLSFGWYESIFQSYLATKPVKVVSSMGQQSVGKSFALNHLLDTSFAGSAMRTTEGVWMSVTPTDAELIVALDFEGVDSVERSLQEDTLLVLFNTAISNLVLFRNNFAFSRDISGLFQSFQSSASVLDPAANPSLFRSTLVIIIKDVVDADKVEITREFSLKFQKIVQQEQNANFISRLHRGKLDIIPWPVIESKEFYKLFSILKKRLDAQNTSHPTAGEFLYTIKALMAKLKANDWGSLSQTMIDHRARMLSTLLPIALATGFSDFDPDPVPLKIFDTDLIVEAADTATRFAIAEREQIPPADVEMRLDALRKSWCPSVPRQFMHDSRWTSNLASYINGLIDQRVNHVRLWLESNLERFQAGHATIEDLRRRFDNMVIEMRANAQLCRAQCASCHLLCVRSRLHEGGHNCQTIHKCVHNCAFCKDDNKPCGTTAGHPGDHVCVVNAHLCGEPCKLSGKRGCLEDCTKVSSLVSRLVTCPCALQEVKLPGGKTYSCPESCNIPSDRDHDSHSCGMRTCAATCDLCKRLCIQPHLHGLEPGVRHLCGESHPCSALCSAPGICQIDTAPLSIEATFTGKHDTFQYTKRLQCIKTIQPEQMEHEGPHIHGKEEKPFHFCETRCHIQQEHETSHGSMTQTRWAIEGSDETSIELGDRRFSSNDEGAPMMCNLVCSSMGRHVHIDYCRSEEDMPCSGAEIQHMRTRMVPSPDKPKDAVSHGLYWRRMDPYTRDEQMNFAKWYVTCSKHNYSLTSVVAMPCVQPSYCKLPIFHPPQNPGDPVSGRGYISNDGHLFECKNPTMMQQAFHVIFVIDRSLSMSSSDRKPLADSPATNRIQGNANNRLGAVYSALYSFWSARHAALIGQQSLGARLGLDAVYSALYNFWPSRNVIGTPGQWILGARRDAYSVVLFNDSTENVLVNDFTSSPDQLLDSMLTKKPSGGTDFDVALSAGQTVMVENWSTERLPVMIFLSDGESSVSDETVEELCHAAMRHGKPLSFHSVSFGDDASTSTLRRMAEQALDIQNRAPRNPLMTTAATAPSSFATALDTVRLTEAFLDIAESLRKPRGSLMH